MSLVFNILLAILVFALIIAVHEFGHMIVAKLFGVGVIEYSLGMGPILFSKRKKDTCYSLRAIPIGGYCSMYGEESLENEGKKEPESVSKKLDIKSDWRPDQALTSKSWWKRLLIYVAGPAVNIVLGFLVYILLAQMTGGYGNLGVMGVYPGTPAMRAGIMPGDMIVQVDDTSVETMAEYSQYKAMHPSTMDGFVLYVNRAGTILRFDMKTAENGLIGILVKDFPVEKTFANSVRYGIRNGKIAVRMVSDSVSMLIRGDASVKDMSGVVGVTAVMTNQFSDSEESAVEAGESVLYAVALSFMSLFALLSINIGLMNLLPFPALDGGRIFLCLIEALIRRPIPQKVEYALNAIGMMLLLILLGVVFVGDSIKLLTGAFSPQ